MPTETTPVTQALDHLNIPYTFFRHPGRVHSLEQAAAERGQRPTQIVRSLLFRLAQDDFVLVLAAGPQQLSWPELRRHLGETRMTMATPEEVLQVTGFPTGAVSPFGLPMPLRTLVDESVLQEEIVSIGAGVRNATIILRRDDLLAALGPVEIADFSPAG